jgi:FMN phosphatase YigB (HAD superfamily)
MSRPLVVTDCDEVLLHMVRHFGDWLGETHGIEFPLDSNPFASMRRRGEAEPLPDAEKWRYLSLFFATEMHRQTAVEGAAAAIAELSREADVVVLTNLTDEYQAMRARQLREHGIAARVFTNQGPKGTALRRIADEYAPGRVAFIDDLAQHHASAAETLPESVRLHFCAEPTIAALVPCAFAAGHAHARLDTWAEALPWLLEALHGERS